MTLPQAPLIPANSAYPLAWPLYNATFTQAVKRFFQKYAMFSGRASRSEYWWVALFTFLVTIVLYIPMLALGAATQTSPDQPGVGFYPFAILLVLWALGVIIPSIALTVRRLHDANFSGLVFLLTLIPYLGGFIVFILALLPSNPLGARFDAGATPAQNPYAQVPYPAAQYPPADAAQPAPPVPPATPPAA